MPIRSAATGRGSRRFASDQIGNYVIWRLKPTDELAATAPVVKKKP